MEHVATVMRVVDLGLMLILGFPVLRLLIPGVNQEQSMYDQLVQRSCGEDNIFVLLHL